MTNYPKQVKNTTDTIVVASVPIEHEDVVLHSLNGLPTQYNAFKTAL